MCNPTCLQQIIQLLMKGARLQTLHRDYFDIQQRNLPSLDMICNHPTFTRIRSFDILCFGPSRLTDPCVCSYKIARSLVRKKIHRQLLDARCFSAPGQHAQLMPAHFLPAYLQPMISYIINYRMIHAARGVRTPGTAFSVATSEKCTLKCRITFQARILI